jgi:hypothetical protein
MRPRPPVTFDNRLILASNEVSAHLKRSLPTTSTLSHSFRSLLNHQLIKPVSTVYVSPKTFWPIDALEFYREISTESPSMAGDYFVSSGSRSSEMEQEESSGDRRDTITMAVTTEVHE